MKLLELDVSEEEFGDDNRETQEELTNDTPAAYREDAGETEELWDSEEDKEYFQRLPLLMATGGLSQRVSDLHRTLLLDECLRYLFNEGFPMKEGKRRKGPKVIYDTAAEEEESTRLGREEEMAGREEENGKLIKKALSLHRMKPVLTFPRLERLLKQHITSEDAQITQAALIALMDAVQEFIVNIIEDARRLQEFENPSVGISQHAINAALELNGFKVVD